MYTKNKLSWTYISTREPLRDNYWKPTAYSEDKYSGHGWNYEKLKCLCCGSRRKERDIFIRDKRLHLQPHIWNALMKKLALWIAELSAII
ncbi:unnamed protein product [Gordionus sp. m RMFG-2023]